MKRGIILLILLALLISPTIFATEEDATALISKDVPIEKVKEQLSTLRGGLDEKTENVLEREIQIPDLLQTPVRIIFGIKENATWQQLIIVLGIFIGFFILILNIVGFIPFFQEGLIKILASLIITTLVSITGALDIMAKFFFDIAGFFKWTSSWGPLRMIIAIVIAIVTIIVFNKVSNIIKHEIKLEKAEHTGRSIWKLLWKSEHQVD